MEVLDYTQTNHINFEAEIRFREDPGVVQVETFGISMNAEGTCFYGMQLEAVMNRIKDNISLDHLSRILVDIQQDSSSIVDSVMSQYQRDLLDLVFIGDASNRNKINLIIANEITPHLTAGEYMDKGEYENEFKQVIGDTKASFDISEQDSLIFGSQGLLVCGPSARNYESLLCAYLQFNSLDLFLQNFFSRIWILNDDLNASYQVVETIEYDPLALSQCRNRLCTLSKEIIMLDQILGYLDEALEMMELPLEPPEQAGRSLYQRLGKHKSSYCAPFVFLGQLIIFVKPMISYLTLFLCAPNWCPYGIDFDFSRNIRYERYVGTSSEGCEKELNSIATKSRFTTRTC